MKLTIVNSGTEVFPFYQVMDGEEEFCATSKAETAELIVAKFTEPTPFELNIQEEVQKIHAQFGTSEMANYHIQKLFEAYYHAKKATTTVSDSKEFFGQFAKGFRIDIIPHPLLGEKNVGKLFVHPNDMPKNDSNRPDSH